MPDHRPSTDEPRTTPVRLRRRSLHGQLTYWHDHLHRATLGRADVPPDVYTKLLNVRWGLSSLMRQVPPAPTVRDLIRAARAVGAPPRSPHKGSGWCQWDGESEDKQWRVVVLHKRGDWTVWMRGPDGAAKINHVTEDRIANAARLCGWDVSGSR